jgi:A/G-specific adenine glycosylase
MNQDIYTHIFPWKKLLDWYSIHGRQHLPWRQYDLPRDILLYRVWLSEILLQQTQAERVKWFFEKIIHTYQSIEYLSEATYDEFFPYYQWLWYYSRARNILKTAKMVHREYGWVFPNDTKLLQKLPWVGPYTAEAIRSFGYNIPTLAWDTNLEKVFSRYFHGNKYQKLTTDEKNNIQTTLLAFIDSNTHQSRDGIARDINNALMDFSSMIDLKNPDQIDWDNYPIPYGVWYKSRWSLEPKEEKKIQSFPIPDATILVFLHENHTIYLSENSETYEPFILPAWLTRDSRKYIKDIFRERYQLELSVRPPHKKWLSKNEKPYISVNAQIQAGQYKFIAYTKQEAKSYILP